ncbi:uncharacterized protein LOC133197530 [Saccostrea echinata]|uniref:uncharacterized protein LOC133197530 n=1 Tax=Saccostrea echinata TaxID=191078 RepID=UPI002A820F2F|nr:uncharacterized protein LOC133197530 [Saccostrea echinata]
MSLVNWMSVLVVSQTAFCIEQPYRLVENTTCLEINSQDRLSCGNNGDYHCLLDENYFNEYEVCRGWKWIPTGKCAYFNTYGRGNVDERDCDPVPGLTCASAQYSSTDNTQNSACYVKKEITTQISTNIKGDGTSGGMSVCLANNHEREMLLLMFSYIFLQHFINR